MLKLQYKDGGGDPVELVAPGKTIGQGTANDIVIDKDGVNGFHADIQVDGEVVIDRFGNGLRQVSADNRCHNSSALGLNL